MDDNLEIWQHVYDSLAAFCPEAVVRGNSGMLWWDIDAETYICRDYPDWETIADAYPETAAVIRGVPGAAEIFDAYRVAFI